MPPAADEVAGGSAKPCCAHPLLWLPARIGSGCGGAAGCEKPNRCAPSRWLPAASPPPTPANPPCALLTLCMGTRPSRLPRLRLRYCLAAESSCGCLITASLAGDVPAAPERNCRASGSPPGALRRSSPTGSASLHHGELAAAGAGGGSRRLPPGVGAPSCGGGISCGADCCCALWDEHIEIKKQPLIASDSVCRIHMAVCVR